jgi:predicted branched-subunit amino acid permease
MFVCLLVFQLHGWLYVMTALVAGVLSVALYLVLPGNAYVMVASVSAATVGALVKRWVARRRVTS